MGSHIEFLTLSLCEWNHTHTPSHNEGVVCSLSDILETGDQLQQYCLSEKACEGILNRAAKRARDAGYISPGSIGNDDARSFQQRTWCRTWRLTDAGRRLLAEESN
jgi:hypothetical protein